MNNLWSDYLLVPVHIDRFLIFPYRYHVQGLDLTFTGYILVSLLKTIEQSRQGLFAISKTKQKKGWLVKWELWRE